MDSLKTQMNTLLREIAVYAKPPINGGQSYVMQSTDGSVLSVIDILDTNGKHQADTGLVVRLINDYIVIEHDMNNKPLVDALVQSGIPRNRIILAYAGEQVPELT